MDVDNASIDDLRDRVEKRQAHLHTLRERLKKAKAAAARPPVKSSISDIQKRYLSAVADLDVKKTETKITPSGEGVSKLTSRFNQGLANPALAKKKSAADQVISGENISRAKKQFSKTDSINSHLPNASAIIKSPSSHHDDQPAELLVEDDDGLPSWAKNQQKLMIRKENARSSIRDVDINELQDNVKKSTADMAKVTNSEEGTEPVARGNVKAALAMWGKTAEEDARVLAKKKEEEEKKQKELLRLKQLKEEEERKQAIKAAIDKFSSLSLVDLVDEPQQNDIEQMAFLQRKLFLIDKEISVTEQEIDKAELADD